MSDSSLVKVKTEFLIPMMMKNNNRHASTTSTSAAEDKPEETEDVIKAIVEEDIDSAPALVASNSIPHPLDITLSASDTAPTTITSHEEVSEGKPDGRAIDSFKSKRKHADTRPVPSSRLCMVAARGETCSTPNCIYQHNILEYLSTKPPDLGAICYSYETYGMCQSGLMCRYGDCHIDRIIGISKRRADSEGGVIDRVQINVLKKEVQIMLRKKKYAPRSNNTDTSSSIDQSSNKAFNSTTYASKVKIVDFANKVYVAPLTTIGNLPFRRILKSYGADITCGEMALSLNLEQGHPSEWALLRRHADEDCFGVQIAGSHADQMRRLAKVIEHETCTDFVDLNCGCPIDLVCNKGCGSALLTKPTRLLEIVSSMTSILSRPVTIKLRTGWEDKNLNAHKIVPMLQKSAGQGKIAAIMIHGRSRLQRYSKAANWEYVFEAAQAQDPTLPLIPIIGNGDILTVRDWQSHQHLLRDNIDDAETIGLCSCAMLGRGAIIKPWLPREIKSNCEYDISATERLEILKSFVHNGLDHWGSDQQGIDTLRRFLLEWLSFLHRYVPVGILDHVQGMQQRPPRFFGRNDLETLFASPLPSDWVKISEMLLGHVSSSFFFEPKHKSSAYEGDCANHG